MPQPLLCGSDGAMLFVAKEEGRPSMNCADLAVPSVVGTDPKRLLSAIASAATAMSSIEYSMLLLLLLLCYTRLILS
jgi:hypothetical protein